MKIKEIEKKINERNEKISKARRIRTLLKKHKGLVKKRKSLVDFDEPVLFLIRRDGRMEFYEKATAGKFVFEHSTGNARFLELRPADQVTFDYGDRKVRGYVAHEDRPYGGWDIPIVDSESVMLGYEKTKATDLKYQERLASLKVKGKMVWVWIILAILGAIIAAAVLIPGEWWDRLFRTGSYAVNEQEIVGAVGSFIWLRLKGVAKFK